MFTADDSRTADFLGEEPNGGGDVHGYVWQEAKGGRASEGFG